MSGGLARARMMRPLAEARAGPAPCRASVRRTKEATHAMAARLPYLEPEALVQLTLSVAAANFTNRFNEALGTELEFE